MTGPPSKVTVLNVDDYEASRYTVSRILRQAGFEVVEAATGADALRLAASRPDLIILDVNLPDMSGFEVCRRIRADPVTVSLMVLHLSSTYVRSEDRAHGLDGGADGYLTGPVEAAELLATVNSLLRLKRAEQEVAAAARQWRNTFDAISDGVALLDLEGRVLRANRALAHALGRPPEALVGRSCGVLALGAAGEGAVWSAFARVRERRRRELVELDVGGRWLQVTIDPVLTGAGVLESAVWIVSDITERKRAEEVLRGRARQQAAVADLSRLALAGGDLAALLDQAAVRVAGTLGVEYVEVLELAPNGAELYLRSGVGWREGLVGRAVASAEPGSPAGDALSTREPVVVDDLGAGGRFRGPPHLAAHGVVSGASVVLWGAERPFGVLGAYTARRRRLTPDDIDFLLALGNVLAIAIQRRRAEAGRADLLAREQAARAEAEAAARARQVFLARASHELRTPLTSAVGTVRLLKRAMARSLEQRPEELLEIASRSLDTMLALVNDLLDASKLDSGREPLAVERVDVAEVVSRGLEVVAAQARDRGTAVRVAVPAGLGLPADRLKLEQVVVNLVANAVKFTPPGGEVTVEARREADHVVIRVRDTGEGIRREHLEAIFEPFFQTGERRERRPRGTGLGLAICRQIVRLHGGAIWAESEGPGRGSTFVVRLPAESTRSRAA